MTTRLYLRRVARRLDGIRLVTFWQALGDDMRAEKAATQRILTAANNAAQTARSTT